MPVSPVALRMKEFEKLKQLSDEFIKQEENSEIIEEEVEEDEEIVIEPK